MGEQVARHDIAGHHHPAALQEIAFEESQAVQPVDDRQQQMVGDHGRHGHRTDHDHANGRGKSADKDQQGKPFLAGLNRQSQHEGIGGGDGQAEQQATHGDGEHKNIDQEHIERKEPHGGPHMVFVEVFDDRDVKLPR
ncbi:MAG: hypothetical protein ACD_75C00170G0001 [uncultured bacterium]|nr:MAG: hypothetical protein ACD_75C00170G0001 [uncultured bacterium]